MDTTRGEQLTLRSTTLPIITRNPAAAKIRGHLTEMQSGGLSSDISATNYPQSTTITNGRVMEIHVNPSGARAFGSHEDGPLTIPVHEKLY